MLDLKIGGVPEHFNLPWRLAIEENYFNHIGLKLSWEDQHMGTGEMVKKLGDGSLDIAVLLTEGVTKAILQDGLKAKILHVFIATPLHWGIHVPFSSPIMTVDDLKGKTFAISRYGSGSHLMTYVKANQEGWDAGALKFKVIGDVEGGMDALEKNDCQAFLWEKYTTFPYTEKGRCRYIDEVVTPWPCFVIAVREDLLLAHTDILQKMCEIIEQMAATLKTSDDVVEIISWRYNLRSGQVANWLVETDWNYLGKEYREEFEKMIAYLVKLNLILPEKTKDWEGKLFLTEDVLS
jgi:ABC-type nitrate/sulfonate/bicarbonate transport system substrate-binding protein